MADGFLGRWSRRKQDLRAGRAVEEPPPPALQEPVPATPVPNEVQSVPPQPEVPPLTLADAQDLTPESDFTPFMARGTAAEVKNAALKKLFTDPHFQAMDGLDIYIDDYTIPSPLPLSVLRQMASAKVLGLVPDDEQAPSEPGKDPVPGSVEHAAQGALGPDVAQSGVCNESSSPPESSAMTAMDGHAQVPASQTTDDHADLRLQPDHATPAPSAGGRSG